jgi:hypothetical protein
MSYEVEPQPEPDPPADISPAAVLEDRPCLQCGYSLRGLPLDGHCPECGIPVANSLRGNLLVYSSLIYLESLHRGAVFVISGVLIGLVGAVVAFFIRFWLTFPSRASFHLGTLDLLARATDLFASLLALFGWWLLSAPDPGLLGEDHSMNSRKLVRIVVAIGAAAALLAFVLQMINFLNPLPYAVASKIAALVGGAASIVQFFASMTYLRWLARRVPDRALHNEAARFMWMGPLIYILGYPCMWLGPVLSLSLYASVLNNLRGHLKRIRREAIDQFTTPPANPPAAAHPTPPAP